MNLQEKKLHRILNFSELKKLFNSFYKSAGIDVALYDTQGVENLAVRAPNSICTQANENPSCSNKIIAGGKKATELGGPYIYETPCKLIMCITPVVIESTVVGFISCGPVALWDKDDLFEKEFLASCQTMGIDLTNFDLSTIKGVSCENMTGLADMLSVMVNYMVIQEQKNLSRRIELEKLHEEREETLHKMQLANEQSALKKYPVEREKELIACVHLGDRAGAKAIINDLLTGIFMYAGGEIAIIQAKLYELIASFSRTAVEAGAQIKDLSGIVRRSSNLLLENADFSTLCRETIAVLDEYLDVVYRTRSGKQTNQHLAMAISFIHQHYENSNLSLEEAAKAVFVSPYYLSHLFRDEMKTTFTNYLSHVRIENAKTLLKEGLSSEEAAFRIGFKNASYFVKIFKKYVGITPAKYRQS